MTHTNTTPDSNERSLGVSNDFGGRLTRSQQQKIGQEYNRLLKRTIVLMKEEVAQGLVDCARQVLERFTLEGLDGPELPVTSDIGEVLSEILPTPGQSLSATFFSKPVFPVKVLYNLAKLYTFPSVSVPEHLLEETEISPAEKSNMNLNAYLWFLYFLGCPRSDIKQYLARYRRTRGPENAVVTQVTSVEPVPAHSTDSNYLKGLLDRAPSNIVSGDV